MALVGVEPGDLGWGEHPSEPVVQALPSVVQQVLQILARWVAESDAGSASPAADDRGQEPDANRGLM